MKSPLNLHQPREKSVKDNKKKRRSNEGAAAGGSPPNLHRTQQHSVSDNKRRKAGAVGEKNPPSLHQTQKRAARGAAAERCLPRWHQTPKQAVRETKEKSGPAAERSPPSHKEQSERAKGEDPRSGSTESRRRQGKQTVTGPPNPGSHIVHMASSKGPNRKNIKEAEIGNLAPLALSRLFREDEEIMEIDSPTLSLKRPLEEKTKNKSKGGAHGKRTREFAKASPSQMDPAEGPDSTHLTKFHFWLGFEAMERIVKEEGIAELFTDETIADQVTRGIPRKEAEELESVSISFPRVPQTFYPSERSDGIKGQHLNLTQLPQDIEIDPISKLSKDFHVAINFQLPNNPLLHNQVKELV